MICSKMNNKWWARCSDFLLLVFAIYLLFCRLALSSSRCYSTAEHRDLRGRCSIFFTWWTILNWKWLGQTARRQKPEWAEGNNSFSLFHFFSSFIQNKMLRQAPTEQSYLISHAIEKNEWEQIEGKKQQRSSIIVHWCVFCAFKRLLLCGALSLTHSLSPARSQISNYK